jgi:NADH dehydrogenase/NADH:ubiquinone oxidoreductase subunit G
MQLVSLKVNGMDVQVLAGSTVLQACEKAGVTVPRFCYHAHLSIAGNCRRCLVEVEKAPKLQVSCALPVMDDRVVYTDTTAVRKAREGVREFLLVNHPLDCPICDQGGECDLQDQAMAFGSDSNRFREYKRAVSDKQLGPLVKTIRTRCIQCTRCVRFASEVAGVQELGTMGRGNNLEISRSPFDRSLPSSGRPASKAVGLSLSNKQRLVAEGYALNDPQYVGSGFDTNRINETIESPGARQPFGIPFESPSNANEVETILEAFSGSGSLNSNLTGNLIDVCPVGALTSRPYAFVARPWELKKIETHDVLTAERSPIRVDVRGVGASSLLRVLPRSEYHGQLPWIGDRTRFAYDARSRQRCREPRVPVDRLDGRLAPCSWELAFLVNDALYFTWGSCIELRLGTTTNREALLAAKSFKYIYGVLFRTQVNICIEPHVSPGYHQGARSDTFCTLGHSATPNLDFNDYEVFGARPEGRRNLIKNELVALKQGSLEDADLILMVGMNPRTEAPVWNVQIRNRLLQKGGPKSGKAFEVARVGGVPDSTYPVTHLGCSTHSLLDLLEGRNEFCKKLNSAQKPLIFLGQSVMERFDSEQIWKFRQKRDSFSDRVRFFGEDNGYGVHWFPTCVGQRSAAYVGIGEMLLADYSPWEWKYYMKFHKTVSGSNVRVYTEEEPRALWCIDSQIPQDWRLTYKWVVYQGSHADVTVGGAGVVRPSLSFAEEGGTYVDLAGKRKQTRTLFKAAQATAKKSWEIIKSRRLVYGYTSFLPTDSSRMASLVKYRYGHPCEDSPVASTKVLGIPSASTQGGEGRFVWNGSGTLHRTPRFSHIENYFRSNRLASFSPTRAKCTLASCENEKRTAFVVSHTY